MALLSLIGMAVVNGGDAFRRAWRMVEYPRQDVWRYVEAGHAARGGTANIVERPWIRDFGSRCSFDSLVKIAFRLTEPGYGPPNAPPAAVEYEPAFYPRQGLD